LALEMAQQLQRAGQSVSLLALFDTFGPGYPEYRPGTTRLHRKFYNLVQQIEHHCHRLWVLDRRAKFDYFREKAHKAKVRLKRSGRKGVRHFASRIYLALG